MNNIAKLRKIRGWSQRDLAELAGVSQPTIQRAEREDKTAKLETYQKCADIFEVPLTDIFETRSEVEDQLIKILRNTPENKRAQLLEILDAAKSLLPSVDQ